MSFFPKLMTAMIEGILAGISLLFIGSVAAVGFAYTMEKSVHLPGLFKAWFTTENGMPALNFDPNFLGMLTWIITATAAFCLRSWRKQKAAVA